MYRLPFQIIPENMGAQYHHYLLGIILQKKENWNFVFNNYIGMIVKHYYDSHGDFAFDGIYSCDKKLMQQLIIRGPLDNLKEIVIQSLNQGLYVVLNINEQNLPHRQAYHNHYFRHDILIYGYDEDEGVYVTAGFDENMEFCELCYPFDVLEYAYRTMQDEWDFEFFMFRWNEAFVAETDDEKIKREIKAFLLGENRNQIDVEAFLKGDADTYYVNNSYKKYYGIQLYDYLSDRIQGQHRLFLINQSNEKIGVNDMRTFNALRAHIRIIAEWLKTTEYLERNTLVQAIDALDKELYGVKILLMKYIDHPDRKGAKKIIKGIKAIKEKEQNILVRLCAFH